MEWGELPPPTLARKSRGAVYPSLPHAKGSLQKRTEESLFLVGPPQGALCCFYVERHLFLVSSLGLWVLEQARSPKGLLHRLSPPSTAPLAARSHLQAGSTSACEGGDRPVQATWLRTSCTQGGWVCPNTREEAAGRTPGDGYLKRGLCTDEPGSGCHGPAVEDSLPRLLQKLHGRGQGCWAFGS